MKIEEFKKRLRECLMDVDSLLDEEIDNLYVFFKEYAKNYARSLVPDFKALEAGEGIEGDDVYWFRKGQNACREEMLRRIEKE